MTIPGLAARAKACCAAAYSTDAVGLVLGDSYHPGGLRLTRRLAELCDLRPNQHVLDVASGPGTTALLLAAEYGVRVDGVDLAVASVERATAAAAKAGQDEFVSFRTADAERLPFESGTFDVVFCECAFCTFPDKATAAAEVYRVLKPGGRLALSDVTLSAGGLPPELQGLAGWVSCVADARSLEDYAEILAEAGLVVMSTEQHDDAMHAFVDQIDARLKALRLIPTVRSALAGLDLDRALDLTRHASRAVAQGLIGYGVLVAWRPDV
jgi:hypothetical protein